MGSRSNQGRNPHIDFKLGDGSETDLKLSPKRGQFSFVFRTVPVIDYREAVMDTKQKIIDILVNLLKVKPQELKEGVTLQNSIGVDSTEMVEVVIAMGKSFGIKIDTKEITKFSTPEDIVKTVESKLNSK